MRDQLSPKDVARAIQVSESSVKRWCDRGLIASQRTAGGHRRIPLSSLIGFLRSHQYELEMPQAIGLAGAPRRSGISLRDAAFRVHEALLAGAEPIARQLLIDLYLEHYSMAEICDRVLAPAFHAIGERWAEGELEIYQESRSLEIARRLLADLRSIVAAPPGDAPLALGATPPGDRYSLPTAMVELVLRESGWRAESLGTSLPFSTLQAAARDQRPALFWLSVSHLDAPTEFLEQYAFFYEQIHGESAVVVGGRALIPEIRQQMRYCSFCDRLQHLESFVRSLYQPAPSEWAHAG